MGIGPIKVDTWWKPSQAGIFFPCGVVTFLVVSSNSSASWSMGCGVLHRAQMGITWSFSVYGVWRTHSRLLGIQCSRGNSKQLHKMGSKLQANLRVKSDGGRRNVLVHQQKYHEPFVNLCSTFAVVLLRLFLQYFSESYKSLIRILLIYLMTKSNFCSFHNACLCFHF